jgi:hypothetical protein
MMQLNDAQRRIALGAVLAVILTQVTAFEDRASERAAWTLAILTVAILLIIAFAKPEEEPVAPPLPSEPERRPIGFIQPV